MGGYGAIYNGLKYHDTFGYIGALSAALVVNEGMLSRTDDSLFFAETRQYAQSCFGQDLKAAVESDVNPKVLVDGWSGKMQRCLKFLWPAAWMTVCWQLMRTLPSI